ncbi:MAG: hypothetical protein HQ475_10980 [SAR202 cluster bacterium]|nr:hypothetical protein [SAR202 cluster bacterium]
MERMIQQFRQTIAATQPWIVVAVTVAAALFLYFAAQGVRYWQAAGNNSAAREQIGRLERATGPEPETSETQEAQYQAKQLQVEDLRQLFDYPATDALMSIVSDTAGDVGLDLVSMTAEEVTIEPRGTLQYQIRPISVVLDGPTDNLRDFLAALYDRVPVVVASNARIVNLDTDPSSQIRLKFYLSPEPIPEEDEGNPR